MRRWGHEHIDVVEQVGEDIANVQIDDFVSGSFLASDSTCEICRAGYQPIA